MTQGSVEPAAAPEETGAEVMPEVRLSELSELAAVVLGEVYVYPQHHAVWFRHLTKHFCARCRSLL